MSLSQPPRHRFIAVEGPIGVGKTTLARRLAESFEYAPLLESVEHNPFLERFYRNPRQGAFAAQLYFLFQRTQQIQELRQNDLFSPAWVADFLMDKDRLFARLTLDADELDLYNKAYELQTLDIPQPDLVIYLQAPTQVLQQRIHRRGVAAEQQISDRYLQSINDAYTEFFYYYDEAPLLIINASDIDLVNNEADYNQLLLQINSIGSGRHYFNPGHQP
ncbi:deoxynucleoside kinase [Aestuariirhabdus litorea]|uniref:Deoxynucleoside kinase n=1 Tax=Aestuariirhabdus litorea TaxID=2528527 RepID=A0A3P3VHQ1_9GAMM|nr:deoxynucleoside kinase [Aestuariirhabdus litorea]RRJ82252.1 deoxynucleoside kinase [Aestuariirhabdus litorea]RWW92420.1 deoxynucleoside kinase [Endozoicomonadaceae bacterium GTF-13]